MAAGGITALRNLAAGAVAGIAAWSSWYHMSHLARLHGEPAEVAVALPLTVDGMLIVATIVMADDKRRYGVVRPVARIAFPIGVIASVAANIAGADPTLWARFIAAWPPIALLLIVEMLARPPAGSAAVPAGTEQGPRPGEAEPVVPHTAIGEVPPQPQVPPQREVPPAAGGVGVPRLRHPAAYPELVPLPPHVVSAAAGTSAGGAAGHRMPSSNSSREEQLTGGQNVDATQVPVPLTTGSQVHLEVPVAAELAGVEADGEVPSAVGPAGREAGLVAAEPLACSDEAPKKFRSALAPTDRAAADRLHVVADLRTPERPAHRSTGEGGSAPQQPSAQSNSVIAGADDNCGKRTAGDVRRPAATTRQLALTIMQEEPKLTRVEVARRLGVSTRRLREVLAG
ncbi:DUF2637 domain-containing protein [Actinoplanes friuliensis]|uniref:DUF2637 domain-containing protein n=1 Tax=Actinoplanes friuliensis DSM 7358 TaxID=1246995 RepID=U5VYI8_9ACTN|nr:DUF2637 domain-containing protein [Actinoplanes friuliensis]AGZ40716.1 hypothetical protein AFR_12150 [Actinoplanes friuliensis DSM 7358]